MTLDPELKKEFKRIKEKQNGQFLVIVLLIALIFVYMVVVPASAQTITMSNPGGMSERDIAAYYPNGTMLGLYNSTSTIITDMNESYIFAMVPIQTNPLDDPTDWLVNGVFPFLTSNVIALVLLVFLIARR